MLHDTITSGDGSKKSQKCDTKLPKMFPDLFSSIFQFLDTNEVLEIRLVSKKIQNIVETHPTVFHTVEVPDFNKSTYFLNKFISGRSNYVKRLIVSLKEEHELDISSFKIFTNKFRFANIEILELHKLRNKTLKTSSFYEFLQTTFPRLRILKIYPSPGGLIGGMGMKNKRKAPERPTFKMDLEGIIWGEQTERGSPVGHREENYKIIGSYKNLRSFKGVVTLSDLKELSKAGKIEKLNIKFMDANEGLDTELIFPHLKSLIITLKSEELDKVLRFCKFPSLEKLEIDEARKRLGDFHGLGMWNRQPQKPKQQPKKKNIPRLDSFLEKNLNCGKITHLRTGFVHPDDNPFVISDRVFSTFTSLKCVNDTKGNTFLRFSKNTEILKSLKKVNLQFPLKRGPGNTPSKLQFGPIFKKMGSLESLRMRFVKNVGDFEITETSHPNLRKLDLQEFSCVGGGITIDHSRLENLILFGEHFEGDPRQQHQQQQRLTSVRLVTPNVVNLDLGDFEVVQLQVADRVRVMNIQDVKFKFQPSQTNLSNTKQVDFFVTSLEMLSQLSKIPNFPNSIKTLRFAGQSPQHLNFNQIISSFGSLEKIIVEDYGKWDSVSLFSSYKSARHITPLESVKSLLFLNAVELDLPYLAKKFPKVEYLLVKQAMGDRYSQSAMFFMDELYKPEVFGNWKKSLKRLELQFDKIGFRNRAFLEKLFMMYSETLEHFSIHVDRQRSWKESKKKWNEVFKKIEMKKLVSLRMKYKELDYLMGKFVCGDSLRFVHFATKCYPFSSILEKRMKFMGSQLDFLYLSVDPEKFEHDEEYWEPLDKEFVSKLLESKTSKFIHLKLPSHNPATVKLSKREGNVCVSIKDFGYEFRKKFPPQKKQERPNMLGGFNVNAWNKSVMNDYDNDEQIQYYDDGDEGGREGSDQELGGYQDFVSQFANRGPPNMFQGVQGPPNMFQGVQGPPNMFQGVQGPPMMNMGNLPFPNLPNLPNLNNNNNNNNGGGRLSDEELLNQIMGMFSKKGGI